MFEDLQLDRRLQLALAEMAIERPTEVQQHVLPAALRGADLLVSAETGSGKTLAYLIPIAQRLLAAHTQEQARQAGTLALVLVPTRELARQVLKHLRALLAKSPLQAAAVTGGADFKYQKSALRRNPEVLVATPGRLLEHCERGSADLGALQILVLDEADRMLDMGLREDVLKIADYCAPRRQVLMLSATLGHRAVTAVAGTLLRAPQSICVGEVRAPHSSIFHQQILADDQAHKDKLLLALLQQGQYQRALVFGNTRRTAVRLAGLLRYHKLRCAGLQGEMSTEERSRVMQQFNDGRVDIVCASDVAARGLDVRDIDLVVNYDVPHSGSDYLHRSGRTGRAGATGLAVSLVSAAEWNLAVGIQRYLKLDFEQRTLPGLRARYKGPKKQKSSGKAVGAGKKRSASTAGKRRTRHRHQKNRGKPHRATGGENTGNDGFAPLLKKKIPD